MFLPNQTVRINMRDYIQEPIVAFGEDVTLGATTPGKSNHFDVNTESIRLPTSQSDLFHSIVAKLLYVVKRGRPDIMLAIAFSCTRVSCSDCEDWSKLKSLLQYLHQTIDEYANLGADSFNKIKTWVDAGLISLGDGVIMCKSTKQKLNTKS
jgi:hypothetical protein